MWKVINAIIVRKKITAFKNMNAIIIDVRTKEEFQTSSNPNSKNIPLDLIEANLKNFDPNKPIIVCCRSGHRSGIAAKIIRKHGFQKVLNGGPWQNTK
ncbi:MAG: hypothetical protein A2381_08260 [Bdellovibrionales bacterium RIFOXYB1_FULL_37_110]|nr:MAG: hypothetical protein A2417_06445 [Bdellovibrionales bacterium RIFOXYC1_FULL_37_79]OFZ60084.1 MAG: hypothetical protein A2381_08260 [Bdellovibrionales bacterium RIFOXYB1_FULL_37_110]OFZ64939.1 MAG: hypothetical protein A2577_02120 [Bdellovibrionales bacterium RIFOXYD1_FULL_36_51]